MRKIVAITLVLFGATAALSFAEGRKEYPNANIEVIIPKNPGGGTDTSIRTLLEFTKSDLPQGVLFVPTNKPAGNGVTGMVEGAGAKGDGYKLVMTTVELAMFPHQGKSPVSYADFTPLVATIADPCSLIVRTDSPYKTVDDFLKDAKANPGKIKLGNSGTGAIYHLAAMKMEKTFGIAFTHIPYNEGIGPAIAALVGGHLDAIISTPGTAKSQVDAGALRILGVMDTKRSPLFPSVPTFKETTGFEFATRAWAVLCGPKDMDPDPKNKLVALFGKTVAKSEFQAAMRKQGIEPVVILGEDAVKMLKEDHETYKALIAEIAK